MQLQTLNQFCSQTNAAVDHRLVRDIFKIFFKILRLPSENRTTRYKANEYIFITWSSPVHIQYVVFYMLSTSVSSLQFKPTQNTTDADRFDHFYVLLEAFTEIKCFGVEVRCFDVSFLFFFFLFPQQWLKNT